MCFKGVASGKSVMFLEITSYLEIYGQFKLDFNGLLNKKDTKLEVDLGGIGENTGDKYD